MNHLLLFSSEFILNITYYNIILRYHLCAYSIMYTYSSNVESLNVKVLWSAIIENDKLSEWQVYEDTIKNRKRLNIQ